jgi:hypothetical protein
MGTKDARLKSDKRQYRVLRKSLFFVAGLMSRHEEARIIKPTVDVRFYNFIHIAANTADEPDVGIRKKRMEDIADAPANNNGHIALFKKLQALPEGKTIKIELLSRYYPIIFKVNQQQPGARIKNR